MTAAQVPPQFSGLQSLAWFSLAGNPACRSAPPIRPDIRPLTMEQLQVDTALGEGASGDVFAAKFEGREVAVKVFKAETSPDGHARDEIAVTCHVNYPNLIKVSWCNYQHWQKRRSRHLMDNCMLVNAFLAECVGN